METAHDNFAFGVENKKAGNYIEAIAYFNKAIETDPNNAHYYVTRGEAKEG